MKPLDETPLTVEQVFNAFQVLTPLIYRESSWDMDDCGEVFPNAWRIDEILDMRTDHNVPVEFYYAPRMLNIGDREVHAGETTALKPGTDYWLPTITLPELVQLYEWNGDHDDVRLLKRGLVHLTKENAVAHAHALLLASGGTV